MPPASDFRSVIEVSVLCRLLCAQSNGHTAAVTLLQSGVDRSVIALWLGHESVETTQIYIDADLTIKERALARTAPIDRRPVRYKPPDELLHFLQEL